MKSCEVNIKKIGSTLKISINGKIDEDFKSENYPFENAKGIHFDLENVKHINSIGIREWIKWVKSAPKESDFEFHNCPKVMVDQMNNIQDFLPKNAKVKSFYVPYYNEKAGTEKNVLYIFGKEFTDYVKSLPTVKDESGEVMELDVVESSYFKFLTK